MNADSRPYISGHRGMVGSALCRALAAAGLPEPITFTSSELDLRDQAAVRAVKATDKVPAPPEDLMPGDTATLTMVLTPKDAQ